MGVTVASAPRSSPRGQTRRRAIGALVIVIGAIAVAASALVAAHPPASDVADGPRVVIDSDGVPISGISSLADLWDNIQTGDGWTILKRGTDYLKANEPPWENCGRTACVVYNLQSGDGCQAGFLVTADVMVGDVVVTQLVGTSTPVPPRKRAVLILADPTGLGRSFQLVEAHCLDG
ncbi:hypothetical protein [Protaetiibacter larvae]|uniref:Uncharacterized protein n=1 Tax=Protaetiibacter larvae TaxID=2592654 RepID=A0A5C1Y8K7_9MICO|nr:hypothetical protein [Protaetiibacter larvae]QEO10096.1 hypothetical protein FLP23_08805 [Protaetiibacter larvae]